MAGWRFKWWALLGTFSRACSREHLPTWSPAAVYFHRLPLGAALTVACRYYSNFWASTERLRPPIKFPMRATASFPRLERWWAKRPPVGSKRPCKCGCSDDAFKCYLTVQAKELMGEGRREVGVKMLRDLELWDEDEGQLHD